MFVNFSIIITLIAVELQLPAWDNFVLFFGFDLPNVSDNYTVPYDRPQPPLLPLNKPTVDLQRFNLMLSKVNYWKVGQLTLGVSFFCYLLSCTTYKPYLVDLKLSRNSHDQIALIFFANTSKQRFIQSFFRWQIGQCRL